MDKFQKSILFFFILCMISQISGCHEDADKMDPHNAILGRWVLIENSLGPISYPGSYSEFRPDSVLYDYVGKGDSSYSQYWFEDSILYKRHVYMDLAAGDTLLVSILPYRFEFINYDKLELELQMPVMVSTFVYKRMKVDTID